MKTHVAILIDESGSMSSVKSDVIGGFNQLLAEQKGNKGEVLTSVTFFNSEAVREEYVSEPIKKIRKLTDDTYRPGGLTPLLDAIGKTVNSMGKKKNVLFVIMTDGYENYSKEYTKASVKRLVEEKQGSGWKFLYLGADLENMSDADGIGIRSTGAYAMSNTMNVLKSVGQTICNYSSTGAAAYDGKEIQ